MTVSLRSATSSADLTKECNLRGVFAQRRLPQQVFVNLSPGYFLFFEYARAFGEGAWRMFLRLAREFEDKRIWFTSIDPDAHQYYARQFGTSAEFEFEPQAYGGQYTKRMHEWPSTSVADAPAYRTDVGVWTGDSERWRCWGERQSNLCVLAVYGNERLQKELALLSDDYVPVLTIEDALRDIVSSEFEGADFDHFAEQLRQNYAKQAT
jgi:hypothetical protein